MGLEDTLARLETVKLEEEFAEELACNGPCLNGGKCLRPPKWRAILHHTDDGTVICWGVYFLCTLHKVTLVEYLALGIAACKACARGVELASVTPM